METTERMKMMTLMLLQCTILWSIKDSKAMENVQHRTKNGANGSQELRDLPQALETPRSTAETPIIANICLKRDSASNAIFTLATIMAFLTVSDTTNRSSFE